MQGITVEFEDQVYNVQSFVFPGGEPQVQIPDFLANINGDLAVTARLQSSESIIALLLATEIIKRSQIDGRRLLRIPYLPFARQDRVMQQHEAFSLKVMANLVNGMGYDEVTVCDPHSDVAAAMMDNVHIIPQVELVTKHAALREIVKAIPNTPIIIAPDAGAAKKAFAVAQAFGLPLLTASKVRDTVTGAIFRTELHTPAPLAGSDVLIVDDICDGGRTFIELAKVLHSHGAGRIFLYVTHGIFSQGTGVFQGLIDGIFTTDSFLSRDVESPDQSPVPLHVSNVEF